MKVQQENNQENKQNNPVRNAVLCGDAKGALGALPDACVDLALTSPPYYRQREYGGARGLGHEDAPELYLEALLETFGELMRVVRPSGNIVYNLGDKYWGGSLLMLPHRFALAACERHAARLVNEITWVKKNPTPRQFGRRLVPSTEPFFHFALGPDYYHDAGSFMAEPGAPKVHAPSPRLGERYRRLIAQSGLDAEKRAKANRALDEAVEEVRRGSIAGFRMKIKGVHAEAFGGQEGGRRGQMDKNGFTVIRFPGRRMKRDAIEAPVEASPAGGHPAAFPLPLVRELAKLLCPPGGLILDPYCGSGTTCAAAALEGREWLGIDIDPSYCELARRRAEKASEDKEGALLALLR